VPAELVDLLKTGGPFGIVLVLMVTGFLVTKGAHDDMRADREAWRAAFETERAAHQTTREALTEEARRADAAVEAAKLANNLLDRLGHRT
jgi:hypothetical protein